MLQSIELSKLKDISNLVSSRCSMESNAKMFENYGYVIALLPSMLQKIDALTDENKKLKEILAKIEAEKEKDAD